MPIPFLTWGLAIGVDLKKLKPREPGSRSQFFTHPLSQVFLKIKIVRVLLGDHVARTAQGLDPEQTRLGAKLNVIGFMGGRRPIALLKQAPACESHDSTKNFAMGLIVEKILFTEDLQRACSLAWDRFALELI